MSKRIDKEERKVLLKDLWELVSVVTLALLDGKLSDREIVRITRKAQKMGEDFGAAWKD